MGITHKRFRGHISKTSQHVSVQRETDERARDPEVCEIRLAVTSDQNVGLDSPSINVRAHEFIGVPYRSDSTMENI